METTTFKLPESVLSLALTEEELAKDITPTTAVIDDSTGVINNPQDNNPNPPSADPKDDNVGNNEPRDVPADSLYGMLKAQFNYDLPEEFVAKQENLNSLDIIPEYVKYLVQRDTLNVYENNPELGILKSIADNGGDIEEYYALKNEEALYNSVDYATIDAGQKLYLIQQSLIKANVPNDMIVSQIEVLNTLDYSKEDNIKKLDALATKALTSLQDIKFTDKYLDNLKTMQAQMLKQREIVLEKETSYIRSLNTSNSQQLEKYVTTVVADDAAQFVLDLESITNDPKKLEDKVALAHFIANGGLETYKKQLKVKDNNSSKPSSLDSFFNKNK